MSKKANEFFYNVGDVKKDEALHEPILENPDADAVCRAQSIATLRSQGFTQEEIDTLFP